MASSSSIFLVLVLVLSLSVLVIQQDAVVAMGNTNIFPHVHKKPDETNEMHERMNDLAADESSSTRQRLAFFPRRGNSKSSRNAAVMDVSRSSTQTDTNTTKVVTKPQGFAKNKAYDSEEEEMIERLVETQE